jgi:hypothetical protein
MTQFIRHDDNDIGFGASLAEGSWAETSCDAMKAKDAGKRAHKKRPIT